MTEDTVGDGGDEGDGEGGGSGTQQDLHLPPTHCMDSNACIRMPYQAPYPIRIQMKRIKCQWILEVMETAPVSRVANAY